MQNTWIVILPPIIVLILSFSTHKVALSLLIGILSATFLYHDFSIQDALITAIKRIWETTQIANLSSWQLFWKSESLLICLFLLILGIIIILINNTGGSKAYVNYVNQKLHTRKAAETSSLILSLLFFIDEYLNILTVGSVMHPLTDKYKIPRTKLAFLVNAIAASLCIIVPFSSWGAFVLVQLHKSGITTEITAKAIINSTPLITFVKSVPYTFYSLTIIAATWFIVRKKISFGLMHKHETIAQKTGNLYGGKSPKKVPNMKLSENTNNEKNSILDFLFPLTLLSIAVITSLFFTNFVAPPALFLGSIFTFFASIIFFYFRNKLKFEKIFSLSKDGIMLMLPTLVVISLAWTFSTILKNDLLTGKYLATSIVGYLNITLFPFIFFLATTAVTLAIGSAWGAMAIMIPIAIQMLSSLINLPTPITLENATLILPTIGAVLSGSIAGIQISPISDIVILASTSTGSYLIDHVKTQQQYVIPIIFASSIAFLLSGLLASYHPLVNILIPLISSLLLSFGIFYSLKK